MQMKIFFLFSFLLIISCTKKEPDIYQQVMDVHNESMEKMDDIYTLKGDLQKIYSDTNRKNINREEVLTAIEGLDSADNLMMDWMHKFNPPDSSNKVERQNYLESELIKIKRVRDLTNETITKAKELLEMKK